MRLSPKLLEWLDGGSPFPFMRLILSNEDSSRAVTGMIEETVGRAWCSALELDKNSTYAKQINNYRDGSKGLKNDSQGDLSCVIYDVLDALGYGSKNGSDITIGEVNEWLDVLVDTWKNRMDLTASDEIVVGNKSKWRESLEKIAVDTSLNRNDMQAAFVRALIRRRLSVRAL